MIGCPICGANPVTVSCVRDWLDAKEMPLHSEWQERMAEYANEIIRLAETQKDRECR